MPTHDDRRPRTGRDDVIRVAVPLARRVAVTIFTPVVFLGLLASPLITTLVGAPVAAVLAVSAGLTAYRLFAERWPTARVVHLCAAIGFGLPLYVEGAEALGKLGGALTITLVAIGIGVVVAWVRTGYTLFAPPPPSATPPQRASTAGGHDSLRELLAAMPLEALFDEWRATEDDEHLAHPHDRHARNRLRALIVEELGRRDPAGAGRWLARGAADPPEHHITVDPPLDR